VLQGRQPDLTIWFDLPATVAAQRLADARAPDRFERQDLAFFERVSAGYAQRHAEHSGRFRRIDANAPREQVSQAVADALAATRWW
jgi:dTMP kinase